MGSVSENPRAVAIATARPGIPEAGWQSRLQNGRHSGVRGGTTPLAGEHAVTILGGSNRPDDDDPLPEIRAGLRAGIDSLARNLLGEPVRGLPNTRTLNFGSRSGSLHVEVRGPKQGLWYDHAESVGGDALALIQHVNGGGFGDAIAWAAN